MKKIWNVIITIVVFFSITGCGPSTGAPSATSKPSEIEIIKITENSSPTSEITQNKIFDQCNSGSSFKSNIQFDNSSSQTSSQDLVLKGGVGGELNISAIAKVTLEGAVEQHFGSSSTNSQGHNESVSIEVPAHTKQQYTIVWRETKREGNIQYKENGQDKTANFSYRIGIEVASSSGQDLICSTNPSDSVPTSKAPANQFPTPTLAIRTVQVPTVTNIPDTSPNMVLAVGDEWNQNGLGLRLMSTYLWPESGYRNIGLLFEFSNNTNSDILLTVTAGDILVTTGSGKSLKSYGFDVTCGQMSGGVTVGAHSRLNLATKCGNPDGSFWITTSLNDPSISEITVRVLHWSKISDARWKFTINR
jgi:hypothetical protein